MNDPLASLSDAQRAHLLLRLTLGFNLAVHGLVRLPHPLDFASSLAKAFDHTPLPAPLVTAFAAPLPFLEAAVGAALLLGLRFRLAVTVGAALIALLTIGSCLQQAWEIAGLQLVYALTYFVLSTRAADLRLALDRPAVNP